MTITYRASKGSNLTAAEVDGNFSDLDARVTALQNAGGGGSVTVVVAGSMASGTVGTSATDQFVASGGTGPYTYTVIAGSLPPGKTLNASTGLVSGTPTTTGTYAFTIHAVDSAAHAGNSAAQSVTIAAAGAPGTVQFTASTFTFAEGVGNAAITISRTGGTTGVGSVSFATAANTATAGSDFTTTTTTVNWAAGDGATKTVNVPIINDSSVESSETFTGTLSSPSGVTLGSPSTMTATITDDDTAPEAPFRFTTLGGSTETTSGSDYIYTGPGGQLFAGCRLTNSKSLASGATGYVQMAASHTAGGYGAELSLSDTVGAAVDHSNSLITVQLFTDPGVAKCRVAVAANGTFVVGVNGETAPDVTGNAIANDGDLFRIDVNGTTIRVLKSTDNFATAGTVLYTLSGQTAKARSAGGAINSAGVISIPRALGFA